MTKACIYIDPEKPHHVLWANAFKKGLERHGVETNSFSYPYQHGPEVSVPDADLHVFWAMRAMPVIAHCREKGQPFVCLDHGYTQDRMNFTSVNLNGLNGKSELDMSSHEQDRRRCKQYSWGARPDEASGDKIFIIGQVSDDMSLEGLDVYGWAQGLHDQLRSQTSHEIVFKPHPLEQQNAVDRLRMPVFTGTIDEACSQARLFLTYSSTGGVDGWRNGVPSYAYSPVSMIYLPQTDRGTCFDLDTFFNTLSFRQYNTVEMETGQAWDILQEKILGVSPCRHVFNTAVETNVNCSVPPPAWTRKSPPEIQRILEFL